MNEKQSVEIEVTPEIEELMEHFDQESLPELVYFVLGNIADIDKERDKWLSELSLVADHFHCPVNAENILNSHKVLCYTNSGTTKPLGPHRDVLIDKSTEHLEKNVVYHEALDELVQAQLRKKKRNFWFWSKKGKTNDC